MLFDKLIVQHTSFLKTVIIGNFADVAADGGSVVVVHAAAAIIIIIII
jgi:hypothetical protein